MLAGKLSKSLFTLRKTITFLFYFWKSARKSKAIFMEYSELLIFWGFLMVPWGRGYHYCTTSFNKAWIKVLRMFKSCCMSEIRDGEDFCQWSWLEIRLNAFPRSTIPQNQFTIIGANFITSFLPSFNNCFLYI